MGVFKWVCSGGCVVISSRCVQVGVFGGAVLWLSNPTVVNHVGKAEIASV